MAERKEKCCSGCKKTLPLNEFYKNKTNEDGKSIYCKPCTRLNAKKYYQKKLLKMASKNNGVTVKDNIFPSNLFSLSEKRTDLALKIALIQRLMLTVSSEMKDLVNYISEEEIKV